MARARATLRNERWSDSSRAQRSQFDAPHLPSTRKRVDCDILSFVSETKFEQSRSNLRFVASNSNFLEHQINDGDTALITFDVVLDVSGGDVLREVVDLLSVDGLEKSRLSTSIRSTHSVSVTSSELESSVVEEKETSVGEGEGKVANDLALFVVFLLGFELESRLRRTGGSAAVSMMRRRERTLSIAIHLVRSSVERASASGLPM